MKDFEPDNEKVHFCKFRTNSKSLETILQVPSKVFQLFVNKKQN